MLMKIFQKVFPDNPLKKKETLAKEKLDTIREMVINNRYDELSEFIASKKSDAAFTALSYPRKELICKKIIFDIVQLMAEKNNNVLMQFFRKNLESADKKTMDYISISIFILLAVKNDIRSLEKMSQDFPGLFMGTDKTQSIIYAANSMALRAAFGAGSMEAIEFIDSKDINKKIDYKKPDHTCLKLACNYGHEKALMFLINDKMLYSAEEVEQINFDRLNYDGVDVDMDSMKLNKNHVLKLIQDREERKSLKNLVAQDTPSPERNNTRASSRKII